MLNAEQVEDEAVWKERLSTWSQARLEREGYCITGLSAYWQEKDRYGRPVAKFCLGPGITLPEHRFENGTQVLVTRLDPLGEQPYRGSVKECEQTVLAIAFEEKFDIDEGTWRLDVGCSSVVFDRMRAAVQRLQCDPVTQEQPGEDDSDSEYILQGTYLRDILLRGFRPTLEPVAESPETEDGQDDTTPAKCAVDNTPESVSHQQGIFKTDMRIQSWARRYSQPNPLAIEGDPVLNLNSTQIRAIAMMLDQRFTLVQGPPGTGKTKTIIEAVKLLKVHFEIPQPILLCTYTNVAVDNLVEGLAAAGAKPLRVGYGGKIKHTLREHTLEYKTSIHPLYPKLESVRGRSKELGKQARELSHRIFELKGKETSGNLKSGLLGRLNNMKSALLAMNNQLNALRGKEYGISQAILRDIVHNSDVVCTTCITSAGLDLTISDFPIVFIDEASMSTEPATLIPLMKGSQHVALIGDHKQLPPVIASAEAQMKGLGISLFERLTEENVVPSIMLDIQYRMHPRISHFPSAEFYDLSLRDGTIDGLGTVAPHLQPPNTSLLDLAPSGAPESKPSVVFLHHGGGETTRDRSRANLTEAHIVCSVVEDLLLHNPTMRGSDIGIIAPYVGQISLLTRMLNVDANYRRRFEAVLGSHRAMQIPFIEVKTVDGFEGREKDVIVFSTVRNNSYGYIGFLADYRRLNVGLTRAKRGLVVIGNIETLKEGRTAKSKAAEYLNSTGNGNKGVMAWRRYTQYLDNEKLIVRLDGGRLTKVLYGNLPDHYEPGRSHRTYTS